MIVHRATWHLAAVLLIALASAGCQDSTESRLLELQAMQQAGEFQETIAPLREILAERPDEPDANYLLGVALLQTGRSSQAILRLEKAAQSEKYAVVAGVAVAAQLFNASNYERAIEVATRVLEGSPDMPSAIQIRTRAEIAAGRLDEALEDAERLLTLNPDDFNGHALKADTLEKLERYEDAAAAYATMREMARESGDADKEGRSCGALGRLQGKAENHDEADAIFSDCLARFPTHGVVLGLAAKYYDEQDAPERGNEAFQRAIEEIPDALPLRRSYADRLEEQDKPDEAKAVLEEATELFDTADAWRALAVQRRRHGDVKGAVEAAERALQRAGGRNAILSFELADLLVLDGQVDRAEELGKTIPQPELSELIRAQVLLSRGDAAGALAVMDEALVLWPNNEGGRMLAGRAAEALGDLDRALSEYREAYKAEFTRLGMAGKPLETDAALSIARVQLARGDDEEAVRWVNVDLRQRPAARGSAMVVGARIAAAHGNYAKARTFLQDAAERAGEPTAPLVLELAGIERLASGPARSLEVIEGSGLDLSDPDHAQLLAAAAGDLLLLDRADEARARVSAAIEAHPEAPELLDIQGRLMLQLGLRDEAAAAFAAALAADPDFAPAVEGQAVITLSGGDLEAGLAQAERALALDPGRSDAAYLAGQALLTLGRRAEAEARFRRALAVDPTHAGACNNLAWILAEDERDLALALELANRAVVAQRDAQTLDTLGWVQHRLGQSQAAVASLEASLALSESPSARYRLALALAETGDADGAKQALTQALEKGDFPESEAARAVLARLAK